MDDDTWAEFEARRGRAAELKRRLEVTRLDAKRLTTELLARLDGDGGNLQGQLLADFLKRPEVRVEDVLAQVGMEDAVFAGWRGDALPAAVRNEQRAVETEIKYAGYLVQQMRSIGKMKKAEEMKIPVWFDYRAVSGLSREMQQTFERVRPGTLGQASRLPGVTPAAVSLLHVYVEIQGAQAE